jgi:hypothetical protein
LIFIANYDNLFADGPEEKRRKFGVRLEKYKDDLVL